MRLVVENGGLNPTTPVFQHSSPIHKVDILFVIRSKWEVGAPCPNSVASGVSGATPAYPPGGPRCGQHYPLIVREREFLHAS